MLRSRVNWYGQRSRSPNGIRKVEGIGGVSIVVGGCLVFETYDITFCDETNKEVGT